MFSELFHCSSLHFKKNTYTEKCSWIFFNDCIFNSMNFEPGNKVNHNIPIMPLLKRTM